MSRTDKVALMVGYASMEEEITAAWAALNEAGIPTTDEGGTPLGLAARVRFALVLAERRKAEAVQSSRIGMLLAMAADERDAEAER